MKRWDSGSVSTVSQAPGKYQTFNFIQDAYKEMGTQLAQSLIESRGIVYTASIPYVLYGGAVATSSTTTTINQGAILYSGEIYTYASQSIAFSASQIFQAQVNIGYDPIADPTTFSDLSIHNIHQIRTLIMTYSSTLLSGAIGLSHSTYVATAQNQIFNNIANYPGDGSIFLYPGWLSVFSNKPRFIKTYDNFVKFQGQVESNPSASPAAGITISSVPLGYRPPGIMNFPCTLLDTGSGVMTTVNVSAHNSGYLYFQDPTQLPGTSYILYLDSIGYYNMS